MSAGVRLVACVMGLSLFNSRPSGRHLVSFTLVESVLYAKPYSVSFVSGLPQPDVPTVLYIVTPARIMNLASSLLRQVLSAVKKIRKTYPDAPIITHLIPEALITGALYDPGLHHGGLEIMADAVYDRALLLVERTASRWLYPEGTKARAFAEPAYALTAPEHKKISFSLEAHPRSLDVFDRHYALHVGYRTSDCGKWLFAACIDQRGEAHDLKAWLIAEDSPEHFIVTSVWDFVMNTATKANVEWRVVISRLGVIGIAETDGRSCSTHRRHDIDRGIYFSVDRKVGFCDAGEPAPSPLTCIVAGHGI